MLIQIRIKWEVAQWMMGCVTSENYVLLVNGSPLCFFKCHKGLRQGCPLSPMLFLLVVEGFGRMLRRAQKKGHFSSIKITKGISITHLFFVDDVVIVGKGSLGDWIKLKLLLSLFCLALGIEVNYEKSCFLYNCIEEELLKQIVVLFDIRSRHLD